MGRWLDLIVVGGVLLPWVGMIVLILIEGHLADRVRLLEERMSRLSEDLGWR